MTSFPGSPRLIKGGIVLIDAQTSAVVRMIALQYNPDTLTRTLQPQAVGTESSVDRSQALRLKGPPVETIKLEAEIDAADQMEQGNTTVGQYGILPLLTALELITYPASSQLENNHRMSLQGQLEIAPMQAPLTLFIWSQNRILPVRLTDFSITEEAFDPNLNPLRAKVNLGLRTLSVSDLGFDNRGGDLYMRYQKEKERLASLNQGATFGTLGIRGIP
ncbi:MAG TPA: hypothetical protein VF806_05275 [Anaerolineaceae bacterium]